MAIRDTTQLGQPVASAPVLPTLPATSPDKLIKAFPQFADYYSDTEKRYKRILEAIRASFDDLAIPAAITQKDVKANYSEFKSNKAFVDVQIKTMADEISASAVRITTLEATVSSGVIDTFVQDDPPAPPPFPIGSLWWDSNDHLSLHRWDGTAWQVVDNSDIAAAIARIVTIEATYVTLTTATTMISVSQAAAVASANGYTAGQITSLSSIYATITSVSSQISTAITAAVTSANTYTNGQITSLSSVYATLTGVTAQISSAVSAGVTTANTYTDGQITSLSSVYATPTYVNAQISTAVSAGVTSANTYTNGQISSLSSVYATPSYVTSSISTSASATLSSANSYTNAQITSVTTAYTSADAALAASIAALSASSGIHTFTGSSTPTATGVGDIWFQTGSGIVHEKRWDGSAWVSVKDSDIDITAAAVITEQSARVSADGNLSGKYTLSVIAGNIVTGMNITSSTGGGTNVSDVTFQASSFNIYNSATATAVPIFQISGGQVRITSNLVIGGSDVAGVVLSGGAAADVNAGGTTISGGKITTNTITSAHILAGNITSTHIASNTVITTSANIGTAVIASANIADLAVSKLTAGTISVSVELTAAKISAGIISTGASRFNTADATRLMPFTSYGYADLVTEFGGPITPADTATSGTAFFSGNVTFTGWTSGSAGVDTKRFGSSTTAFLATLQGNGNVPTGRMGYDMCYRVNGGSWVVFTGHNVVDNTSFGNISMSILIPISGLAGGDTVEFGAMIDHSSGAVGPGIGGLFISVGVFNG